MCKTWWSMFAYFFCRWIFWIVFTSINLFYYTLKIYINNNWCFVSFWYWLNSNILVSSGGIMMLQKSLFSHTSLSDLSVFSFAKKWRQSRQQNSSWYLEVILLKNGEFFYCKIMPLLSCGLSFASFGLSLRS